MFMQEDFFYGHSKKFYGRVPRYFSVFRASGLRILMILSKELRVITESGV